MNIEHVFEHNVRSLFGYLETSFGFKALPVERNPLYDELSISYERDPLFVKASFCQQRGSEISINFGRMIANKIDKEYSFHMYLGIVNPPVHYQLGGSMISSQDEVIEILGIYAAALQIDGLSILRNEDIAFKKIKDAEKSGKGLCVPDYMQPQKGKITSKFNGED